MEFYSAPNGEWVVHLFVARGFLFFDVKEKKAARKKASFSPVGANISYSATALPG